MSNSSTDSAENQNMIIQTTNRKKIHKSELLLHKQCEPKYTKYKCEE